MHLQLLRRLFRPRGSTLHIPQIVPQLLRLAQLIHIAPLPRPRDPPQQQRPEIRPAEIRIVVPRDANEGPIAVLLIGPDLRLDIIDADFLAPLRDLLGPFGSFLIAHSSRFRRVSPGQNVALRQYIHVIVNFIIHCEIRHTCRDRCLVIREVQMHRPLPPFRLPMMPGAANDPLEPVMVLGHRRRMDRHNATPAL